MTDSSRVLVYGDSLTWGSVPVPNVVPTVRHPEADRWGVQLGKALGESVTVIEEGLPGRTTNVDDPLMGTDMNGLRHFSTILASHVPLDLVVIMLGTNDLKAQFDRTPFDIGVGAMQLIDVAQKCRDASGTRSPAPRVALISPPVLGEIVDPWHQRLFRDGVEKSRQLAAVYRDVAQSTGAIFADASTFTETSGADGIHLQPADNTRIAEGVADVLRREWLEQKPRD